MGECGVSCAKYSVFFTNLLFAVTGIALFTLGTFFHISYNHFATFTDNSWIWTVPTIMMIIGGAVFLIAFLGWCGVIKESSCMVLTFSILLITIFLVEFGVGIAGYAKHDEMKQILDVGFNKTFEHYEANQKAWEFVQSELECCGINGPKDWINRYGNETLPRECCKKLPTAEKNCTMEYVGAKKEGCEPALLRFLEERSIFLACVGIGIALIQIISFSYACFLCNAFRRHYEAV